MLSSNGASADHGQRANDLRVAILSRPPNRSPFAPRSFDLARIDLTSLSIDGMAGSVVPDRRPAGDLDKDGIADLALTLDRDAVRAAGGVIAIEGLTLEGAAIRAELDGSARIEPLAASDPPAASVVPLRLRDVPGAGRPTLELQGETTVPMSVTLFDVRGRRIGDSKRIEPGSVARRLEWPEVSSWPSGIYFARVTRRAGDETVRIVHLR